MGMGLCLAGMFVIWTVMFGGGCVALLRTFGIPWDLSVYVSLPPSIGLALGSVSLFSRVLRRLDEPKGPPCPFQDHPL